MRRLTTSPKVVLVLRFGLVPVALAALVGCGARSSAATVAAAPTASHAVSSTRSGTSRSTAGVAIDRHIAGDAQLRRSDFPSGWTSSPRPAATTGRKCPAIRGARAAVSAHAASREFVQGSRALAVATADSAAYVYADTAGAKHWFALLSDRNTRTCLVRVLGNRVGAQVRAEGATLDSITASRVTIAPVGDQHAADRIVVRVSAGGFTGRAEADVVFVRVGRGLVAFTVSHVGGRFDPSLETRLVGSVTDRLAAGLKGAG